MLCSVAIFAVQDNRREQKAEICGRYLIRNCTKQLPLSLGARRVFELLGNPVFYRLRETISMMVALDFEITSLGS
jgi:hypothetical protein